MGRFINLSVIYFVLFLSFLSPTPSGAQTSLNTLLDNQTYTFYCNGPYRASSISVEGGSSLQSGAIGDNEEFYVYTAVNGPGKISFYFKVSAELNCDGAAFSIDNNTMTVMTGEEGWSYYEFDVPAGTHFLIWAYIKDISVSAGSDCFWLDKVVYTPLGVPVISVNPASLSNSCQQGQNAASQSFEIWNSGGGTLSYSLATNAAWLSCSPTSGASTGTHNTITVNYSTTGLAAGTYNATITITAAGASNTPQTIPVTLTVNPSSGKGAGRIIPFINLLLLN